MPPAAETSATAPAFTVPASIPTPKPTASPAPTGTPLALLRQDVLWDVESNLLTYREASAPAFIRTTRNGRIYTEPDLSSSRLRLFTNEEDSCRLELALLSDEPVYDEKGQRYYHVRQMQTGLEGYLPEKYARDTQLTLTEKAGFAVMLFSDTALRLGPDVSCAAASRESYHFVRFLYECGDFSYVITQEGSIGFIKTAELLPVTEKDILACAAEAKKLLPCTELYSPEAFVKTLLEIEEAESGAELIYTALSALGLDFNPYYYRFFAKDLANVIRYPKFYKDGVYNSLAFKLFNTAGNLVLYNGQSTQWAYLEKGAALEKGDLLFFADTEGGEALAPEVEVAFRGPCSGYITGCGVYLGENKALTVENGTVAVTENFTSSPLYEALDCGRRIHTAVFDEKQLLTERLISLIYDQLGTPYVTDGTGEYAFDCSGLLYWCYERLSYSAADAPLSPLPRTTAQGFASKTAYGWGGRLLTYTRPVEKEAGRASLEGFKRGDIVFLLSEKGGRVGHVMVCLGNGYVIHSTRINRNYSGTLVAKFRPALQRIYYTSLRLDSIS